MNLEDLFCSHGKSNSCGVAIDYCGTEDLKVINTARDKNGRMLILDAELNGTNFLLTNFEIFIRWSKHLSSPTTLPSTVACQFIWFNKHIQTDNKSIYLYNFLNRNLNFVGQLFDTDGKLKSWDCVKHQIFLKNNKQFQYRQIIHALPQHWKETIKQFAGNLNNLYIQNHHLIKCNTIYNLEKLNSK